MKFAFPLCLTLFCLAVVEAEEVEVLKHGDLSVFLIYPESATLADQNWLSIEFRNVSSEKIKIAHASYRIDKEVLVDGELHSTGSLASGNTYDLFPHWWEETPVLPHFIEPGIYAESKRCSRYSSALLDFPRGDEFEVKARFYMDLTLADGTNISTPDKGIPFTFRWRNPDSQGLAAIENEILAMLDAPEDESASVHGYRLSALLKAGPFDSITPDRLLRAIDLRRNDPWSGREELIELYLDTFDDISPLQEYYRDHIPEGWSSLFKDVTSVADALWRDDFLTPLIGVAISEQHPCRREAFTLLSKMWRKWHDDTEVCSSLSRSTKRYWKRLVGVSEEEAVRENDLYTLTGYIRELGDCRDPNAVATLLPYLKWDSRHITRDEIPADFHYPHDIEGFIIPPSFRIRDEALCAILTIQYGDAKLGLTKLGYHDLVRQRSGGAWKIEEEDRWREVIIKKVLDAEE